MSSPEIPDFSLGLGRSPERSPRHVRQAPRLPAQVETLVTPAEPPELAWCRARLAMLLGGLADPQAPRWWVGVQPVVAVSSGPPLRPDLAAWRGAQAPGARPPDRVGDIVQPGNAAELRVHRRARYQRLGVSHSWLLDPLGRVLEAYRQGPHGLELLGAWTDGDTATIGPFEALRVEVSTLLPPR